MNAKAPIDLLDGNHIVGALIGAAISAPATAWMFYGFGNLISFDFYNASVPVVVTGISAFMAVYAILAFAICWILGGAKDIL